MHLLLLTAQLLAAVLATQPSAAPAAKRPDRGTVQSFLREHQVTQSAAEWHALGPGIEEVLVEIARDPKVDLPLRARAVTALGVLPGRVGRSYLEGVLQEKKACTDPGDCLLLRKAAVAYGWIGGAAAPARLGPLMDHADPEVRTDAAIALGLTRSPEAASLLRERLEAEKEAKVRSQISRQLRLIEQASAER